MPYYAGIGSRETPGHIMKIMIQLANGFAKKGWTLRSGGAIGADQAFEAGAGNIKQIYHPWAGYNERSANFTAPTKEAIAMAAKYHPNWPAVKQGGQKLHGRNCHIMLGHKLEVPVSLVICWTSDGRATGGTGQAMRMCPDYKIPIYNLYWDANITILKEFLGI